jgi:beta-lactamase class A
VLAVAGVVLLIAAGIVAVYTLGGSGARPPGHSAAAATDAVSSGGPSAAAAAATASSPAPRPAASHYDPFGSAAASYVSRRNGVVLAAVYDLRTGQTWQFGRGQPQDEASVVKLDVLETLLAERGRSGTELSASDRTLAEQMIEDSDNDAATSLWDEVGGASGIRSFNTSAGLADTVPSSCVNCPGFPWPGWGLTTTIPGDQLTLLRTLVEPNSLLTDTERSYALSLMENVTPDQRWGVSGGVPAQATVALKNGWLPLTSANNNWQINSVGWISGSGRDYLIAVLTTGNPTEQYGIDTIDQLAAMVWNAMA